MSWEGVNAVSEPVAGVTTTLTLGGGSKIFGAFANWHVLPVKKSRRQYSNYGSRTGKISGALSL